MHKKGALLTAVCVFLLFTLICTFPLQRQASPSKVIYKNQTMKCRGAMDHKPNNVKNMPLDLEDILTKIRNITYNENGTTFGFSNKNLLNEEDLRHYEQLVIMKKYPFLDIKELEMKYSPTLHKDTRQSIKFQSQVNIAPESSICDPVDDSINVEIINRGLSGFAIPTQIVKHMRKMQKKIKDDLEHKRLSSEKLDSSNKTPDRQILKELRNDLSMFIDGNYMFRKRY